MLGLAFEGLRQRSLGIEAVAATPARARLGRAVELALGWRSARPATLRFMPDVPGGIETESRIVTVATGPEIATTTLAGAARQPRALALAGPARSHARRIRARVVDTAHHGAGRDRGRAGPARQRAARPQPRRRRPRAARARRLRLGAARASRIPAGRSAALDRLEGERARRPTGSRATDSPTSTSRSC